MIYKHLKINTFLKFVFLLALLLFLLAMQQTASAATFDFNPAINGKIFNLTEGVCWEYDINVTTNEIHKIPGILKTTTFVIEKEIR